MGTSRRAVTALPGVGRLVRTLDATRDERDRLRRQRDRLREENAALRDAQAALREEHAELQDRHARLQAESGHSRKGAATSPYPAAATGDATRSPSTANGLRSPAEQRALEARLSQPSFFARLETLRRVRALAQDEFGVTDPIWAHNSKSAGYELARSLGVRVPELVAGPTELDELARPTRARVVVKPVEGSTARGVMPLVAADDGAWHLLFDLSRTYTWEQIVDLLRDAVAEGKISSRFIVEELIPGPGPLALPYDWKLYCVGGRVQLVLQRDARNQRAGRQAGMRFWTREFTDLGQARLLQDRDQEMARPHHPGELVAVAERIAAALPGHFVRVDLYDAPDGVVFGEITPQPGGQQLFRDDLDRQLGEAWDRAEAADFAARVRGDGPAPA
ncbi:ATP-grasp fold amidoligase family protein [Egicoccus sp. AB-alg2]|uniref:ATP-grasp fold amidoligase family protein n=1 Tax=Egicoccus sp. AB-alg2 TaxID=3242693 RepID=UPI00359D0B07